MSTTSAAAVASAAPIAASHSPPSNQPGQAIPPLPPLPSRPTRAMTGLAGQPPLRALALRPSRTTSLVRPTNLEAALGQAIGQAVAIQCTHCAGGFGAWMECVAVAGFFGGSCANCHYGSEGSRCSFRATPAVRPGVADCATTASATGGNSRMRRRVATVRREASRVAPIRHHTTAATTIHRHAILPTTGRIRRPRRTSSERARSIAGHLEALAVLFREEAVVREEEDTDWSASAADEEEEDENDPESKEL